MPIKKQLPKRRKRKGNIRTLRANQMDYLLSGHLPHQDFLDLTNKPDLWECLIEAMHAAYRAGQRSKKP